MRTGTTLARQDTFRPRPVDSVAMAMRHAAAAFPDRVDPPIRPGAFRIPYIDVGERPACLMGVVLTQMGLVPRRIRRLEHESRVHGQTPTGAVDYVGSTDPLVERLESDSRLLLAHLQRAQDRQGWVPWGGAVSALLDLDAHDRHWAVRDPTRIAPWRRTHAYRYAKTLAQ